MKPDHWRAIAEVTGITAIVASLIFVGLQIKQSQDIAIATQYQERANAAVEMFIGHIQSDTSLRILGETLQTTLSEQAWTKGKTPQEVAWHWNQFMMLFTIYDNNHFQYEAGFLDEDSWKAFRNRMRSVLARPANRALLKVMAPSFRPEFRSIAEEVVAEIESNAQ